MYSSKEGGYDEDEGDWRLESLSKKRLLAACSAARWDRNPETSRATRPLT